jgi:hypothetical protein
MTGPLVKRFPLQIIALLTILSYSVMAISPLVTFAAKSEVFARAVIGECTGECAKCGCSLESRVSKTCCCSKKEPQKKQHEECEMDTKADAGVPVISTCPCGSKKILAFWGEEYQLLPDHFTVSLILFEIPLACHFEDHPASRFNAPPDPPPEFSFLS